LKGGSKKFERGEQHRRRSFSPLLAGEGLGERYYTMSISYKKTFFFFLPLLGGVRGGLVIYLSLFNRT